MSDARPARIVVVGSLNIDLVVRVDRGPEPGETVTGLGYRELGGGKGANQAVAAAKLLAGQGASVSMIGRVGADAFGRRLRQGLHEAGVDADAHSLSRGAWNLARTTARCAALRIVSPAARDGQTAGVWGAIFSLAALGPPRYGWCHRTCLLPARRC